MKLHAYQEYCANFILENRVSLLLLEMGLGKTLTTLKALEDLKEVFGEARKVLVIAPLNVAKYTWDKEVEKWGFNFKVSKILGTKKQREEALRKEADLYVINRENVVWLVNENYWPFDTLVIDELSSFKSQKSKRFKALRKVRGKVDRFIGLTGTPSPNGLMDLWAQVYLADQGERLGKTITSYRRRYFYPAVKSGYIVYRWALQDGAEDDIYEQIDDIAVSMKAKDYLDLPSRVDNIVDVHLNDKEKKLYNQLEKDYIVEYQESDIVALNPAALSNKLVQLANGAVYDDEKKAHHVHDEKIKVLEGIVEEAQGEPILVYYKFQSDKARLLEHFKQAQVFGDNLDEWNRGEVPMLVAHPASIGHGLNLQEGGHIIVWFGLDWSLELYQQANARLDRQGQTKPVVVHHLVTKGTIDEDIIASLEGKREGQDALMEAVKARLEEVNDR